MRAPAPSFAHVSRLTDETGLFEHAEYAEVRRQHGYCTDDVARGLVVTCREPEPSAEVIRLAECYLTFLINAQDTAGAFHNRLSLQRRWTDETSLGDLASEVGQYAGPVLDIDHDNFTLPGDRDVGNRQRMLHGLGVRDQYV